MNSTYEFTLKEGQKNKDGQFFRD